MKETLAGLILAAFTFIVSTSAQDRPPDPDGYRMEDYRAPVPATLAGVRVLTTAEAASIWRAKAGVFMDVMPRSPDLSLLGIATASHLMNVTDDGAFRELCNREKPTHIFHAAHPPRDESP